MSDKYYAKMNLFGRKSYAWEVYQRDAHGDRRLAADMSERTARKITRLLNDDYNHHCNAPMHPVDSVHG